MSQPSVSQHIQALEQSFGQPLFTRLGRRIDLTAAGEALVPLARDMVKRSIQIEETMKSLEGEVHGQLMVGCSTTPGKYVLPVLLARFHQIYPMVRVACTVGPQSDVFSMLCDGDVHVALISEPYMRSRDVETRRFVTDPIMLIAPVDHPWALRGEIEMDELLDGRFIFRETGSGTQTTVRRTLAEVGVMIEDLTTVLTLGSSEAIALSVEEGIGVGFVSNIVVTKLVGERVAPVHVRGLQIEREIHIGLHTRRPATVAQRVFWDFIKSDSIVYDDSLQLVA
jgi:DNA-binding transcriptional LysR family regulator